MSRPPSGAHRPSVGVAPVLIVGLEELGERPVQWTFTGHAQELPPRLIPSLPNRIHGFVRDLDRERSVPPVGPRVILYVGPTPVAPSSPGLNTWAARNARVTKTRETPDRALPRLHPLDVAVFLTFRLINVP